MNYYKNIQNNSMVKYKRELQKINTPEVPLHGRYPEPDEFKVEVTYTYWVSYSRQAYTQNTQNTSINLSIGRGIDVLANTLELGLV